MVTFRVVRLADVIGRFLGKVEIVLAGADDDLRAGQLALAEGDAMGARSAAHRVLEQAPASPLGLALLADACESAHLDAELALTLEELALRAPSRAEVWVRLARARGATGAPAEEVSDAFARALTSAESGSEERVDALVGLADLDLARGDGARAELWLERAAVGPVSAAAGLPVAGLAGHGVNEIAVRLAEARLLRGDPSGATAILEKTPLAPADGRGALVRGRALAMLGDPAAFVSLVRAMVLDTPGAQEALASALAHIPTDAQTRTRVRSVVDAKGEQGLARWRAAFARAEGAREAARQALREAVATGDGAAARPLLDASIDDRDPDALRSALAALEGLEGADGATDPFITDARRLADAFPLSGDQDGVTLDAVADVAHPQVAGWAEELAVAVARRWVPGSGDPADWPRLLARLDTRAHEVGDLDATVRLGELAAERSRPVRLAVVGEFNAGKSTFINALIGADVAPTGVLPTTATLHHLRWAPDPFAKILFAREMQPEGHPTERIVALYALRSTLATLDPATVTRVELRMPLATLVRVEILDTPGFNATDPRHARVARAAFEEADVALWLLDATQAMKQSELTVLESARDAGLPVQVLVNKADRLGPADLERVMEGVSAGLRTTGLASWGAPVAFSAKKALASRIAGAASPETEELLARSGWPAVQALLDQHIVERSAELKEHALRRRALRIVTQLVDAWTGRASEERTDAEQRAGRAHGAARAAGRLEREAGTLVDGLAATLEPRANEWARDLDLVFVGRDRDAVARDPVLARYRTDRAVAVMAPALARAMTAMVPESAASGAEVASAARAIVRAAAGCAPADARQLLAAIAEAAVVTLADQMFAASVAPSPPPRAVGVLRELKAFAAALES